MKIVAVNAYIKAMALTKPYTIAYQTFSSVKLAFFEVVLENGMIGVGSGSPAEEVVGETTEMTLLNLQSDFVKNIIGKDIRQFQQIIFEVNKHFYHLPGTQAAIDIALHDAFGKFMGISVLDFYGQKINALATSVTIGIKDEAGTLEEAAAYKAMGFKILKVKTGLAVQQDIERVLSLKSKFKNDFIIRVDANQGYTLSELVEFINATKEHGIELIEQPLKVGKEKELLTLSHLDRKIICVDESLKDATAALGLAAEQTYGIYNIKLMKCGGLLGAKEIATIAQNASIDLFWGCNDESIISITAALQIAYSCPNTKYIDLDGSLDLAEDLVTGGFEINDGFMHVNHKAGFGFDLIKATL
jgi:L-alanine-DL-glutamate epimerase-like enolase superfamily enzyme